MALVSCHRILSPWPHAAGQTLVYLYHVIKFSPVYLDPLEGLSRIVCHMRWEDMITLGGVEQRGDKMTKKLSVFCSGSCTNKFSCFFSGCYQETLGIWWCSRAVACVEHCLFYHIAEFSQKGGMSCTWLTYLNKSLHPPLSLPFPVNAVGQD